MFIRILLFIIIGVLSYLIVDYAMKINLITKINKYVKMKNEKYYEEMLKNYEKTKKLKIKTKLNIFHKINISLERAGISSNLFINPITILILSLICFIITYILAFNFFEIVFLSIIISLPCLLIPMVIINFIGNYKNSKIEKIFLNVLLQLKNYTKINNDIIYAMQQIETIEPLQSYINIFLIEINSGIKFEKAISNFKEKIKIKTFKDFLSNLEYCYLYGGSFTVLIDKSYKLISEIQNEKNIRNQETKSARMVLFILIFLNIFVYITNIKNNHDNYIIMQKSIVGNIILYWNFISMWLLIVLASKVKKLDY